MRQLCLGRVDVGFQPDPGPGQVQKTPAKMGVFVIAGGRAPPPLEPAESPFDGIARLVPFGVVRPGVRAPLPGQNDGLNVPRLPSRAEGVAVIGPVGDQAGQGRPRPSFHQGLGAVVARAARQAQVQGTAAAIRQHVDLDAELVCHAKEPQARSFGHRARSNACILNQIAGRTGTRIPIYGSGLAV